MHKSALSLVNSIVNKSGGWEKWGQLLKSVRKVTATKDRVAIARFARNAVQTDEGSVQMVTLMMLGLTLGSLFKEEDTCIDSAAKN